MDSAKKILILHASAGHGHQKAAEAIADALQRFEPDARVEVRDALDFFPPWLKKAYAGIYLYLINKHPNMWGFNYALFDWRPIAPLTDYARRCFNGLMAPGLSRLIQDEHFDLVFCTHFMSAEIIADLKRQKRCPSRSVTVITDFLVHRFWVFKQADLFAVAVEKTRDVLVRMGIEEHRIRVTGIPIDAKFGLKGKREDAARKLGLDPRKFTVLLTSGGAGSGPMLKVLRRVVQGSPEIQVAVIAGRNEGFRKAAEALGKEHAGVKAFGFVNNMDEFMDACDVLVGKGGGLTLSEALAKRKLAFILNPVPGQETHNAACLEAAGAAVWVHSMDELEKRLGDLAQNPAGLRLYEDAIAAASKPDSARRVVEAGMSLLARRPHGG